MNTLRWIAYALLGLIGAPLSLEVLRPREAWYDNRSLWYSVQGLAPQFGAFFVVALLHVASATLAAPNRKVGASRWAAIWTMVIGAFIFAPIFAGAKFWGTSALGSISGALAGCLLSRRFLISNKAPTPRSSELG